LKQFTKATPKDKGYNTVYLQLLRKAIGACNLGITPRIAYEKNHRVHSQVQFGVLGKPLANEWKEGFEILFIPPNTTIPSICPTALLESKLLSGG
jgi:hypothetical protein